MKVLTTLDMNKNQIVNAILQNLVTAPENPREGQYYYNSTDKMLYLYNGTAWVPSGIKVEASEINGNIKIGGEEVTVYSLPLPLHLLWAVLRLVLVWPYLPMALLARPQRITM